MWLVIVFLCLGLFLMGLIYGFCGIFLVEIYLVEVCYIGVLLLFNLVGILGVVLVFYLVIWLVECFGLVVVGYYLCLIVVVMLCVLVVLYWCVLWFS